MSVPAPDSSSTGRLSPDSGRISPANDPQSYETQVNYRLEQFRAECVEDFDKIKGILMGLLHPEQRATSTDARIKAHGDTLRNLANRAEQLGESSRNLFINRVAQKIQEIEKLSPRAKAKLAIENKYSRIIDKCLDFPYQKNLDPKDDDFQTVQNILSAVLTRNSSYVPSRFNEAYKILRSLYDNKDSRTGVSLLPNLHEAAVLTVLLTQKISAKLDEICSYSEEDKQRVIAAIAFHKEKGNYQELIHAELDKFPIGNLKDFDFNRNLFAHLLDPSRPDPTNQIVISNDLNEEEKGRLIDLKERIESLHLFFENPDWYAKPEHVEGLKKMMKDSLERAILEIDRMSDREKETRVINYQQSKSTSKQKPTKDPIEMKVNSENQTISEDQMIANMNPPTTQIQAILRSATLSEQEGLTGLRNLVRSNLDRAREYGVEDLFEGNSITNLSREQTTQVNSDPRQHRRYGQGQPERARIIPYISISQPIFEDNSITQLTRPQTGEEYLSNLTNTALESIFNSRGESSRDSNYIFLQEQIGQRVGQRGNQIAADEDHELIDEVHELLNTQNEVIFRQQASYAFPQQSQQPNNGNSSSQTSPFFDSSHTQRSDLTEQPITSNQTSTDLYRELSIRAALQNVRGFSGTPSNMRAMTNTAQNQENQELAQLDQITNRLRQPIEPVEVTLSEDIINPINQLHVSNDQHQQTVQTQTSLFTNIMQNLTAQMAELSQTMRNERTEQPQTEQEVEVQLEQQVEITQYALTPEAAWLRARNELNFLSNNRQQWTAQPMAEQMRSLQQIVTDLRANSHRIAQLSEDLRSLIGEALFNLVLFIHQHENPVEIPNNILENCNNIYDTISLSSETPPPLEPIEPETPEARWGRANNELNRIHTNQTQWISQGIAEQLASLRRISEDLSNNDRISQLNEGPLIRTSLEDLNLFLLHNQYPTEIPQNIIDLCNNLFGYIDLYE